MNRFSVATGLLAGLLMTAVASATPTSPLQLLTFDDVTTGFTGAIPQGYGGLQWSNFDVIEAALATPVGLQNSVVSVSYVGFNGDTSAVSAFGGAGRFTLLDAYFGAAARDGLTIDIAGGRGGQLAYLKEFTVDTLGASLEAFNWSNIDTVVIAASGGTLDSAVLPAQDSTIFALDNLRYQFVPEPGAIALLGLGIGAVALRRRSRAA